MLGRTACAEGCPAIHALSAKETSGQLNTYSGNYGRAAFPLHTDLAHWYLPPRYLVLRCIIGMREVSTQLLDSATIFDQLGLTWLRRTLMQPRRPLGNSRSLLRLVERAPDRTYFCRWDPLFLVPATEESARSTTTLSAFLDSAPLQSIALENGGDTLIIDNWRMLHGRSKISITQLERRIDRAYLGEII